MFFVIMSMVKYPFAWYNIAVFEKKCKFFMKGNGL